MGRKAGRRWSRLNTGVGILAVCVCAVMTLSACAAVFAKSAAQDLPAGEESATGETTWSDGAVPFDAEDKERIYLLQLERVLADAISQMESVAHCSVHVMPAGGGADHAVGCVTVLLTPKGEEGISEEEVAQIKDMAVGAAEGIDAEDVTVAGEGVDITAEDGTDAVTTSLMMFGATEKDKQRIYLLNLREDFERMIMIMGLGGIEDCRVFLVPGRDAKDRPVEAATVWVRLGEGEDLTKEDKAAVEAVVSGAIRNLPVENVTAEAVDYDF